MVEPARLAGLLLRRRVGDAHAIDAVRAVGCGRPFDVVADEQIELSVAVVIDPCGACTPARRSNPGGGRNVAEDADLGTWRWAFGVKRWALGGFVVEEVGAADGGDQD